MPIAERMPDVPSGQERGRRKSQEEFLAATQVQPTAPPAVSAPAVTAGPAPSTSRPRSGGSGGKDIDEDFEDPGELDPELFEALFSGSRPGTPATPMRLSDMFDRMAASTGSPDVIAYAQQARMLGL